MNYELELDLSVAANSLAFRTALLHVGPRAASAAGLGANWCLEAAGMTRELYAEAGFDGVRILGVKASVFNLVGWDHQLRGIPVSDWPDDAYSAGIRGTGRTSRDTWDGHAVAYVPAKVGGGQAWLIDLSAPQMSRPEHGIEIPPVALPVDGSFFNGDPWSWQLPGAMLTMTSVPALTKSARGQIGAAESYIKAMARLFNSLMEVDIQQALAG